MTKTTNTPSTEGNAPDTAATTSTAATDTAASTTATSTATADTNATKATATDATATTPADAEPAAPEQNINTATLSVDYLKGGYYRGQGKQKYTSPDLIDYAKVFGKALAESGTPASAMNKMVRTLKKAARLPYEAQQGALKKLTPQVLDLEHKKKAPALLREVVERNTAAVQNSEDYSACVDHFKDIAIYLQAAKA